VAGARRVRGWGPVSDLAKPDRHESLREFARAAATASASESGDPAGSGSPCSSCAPVRSAVAAAYPDGLLEGIAESGAEPGELVVAMETIELAFLAAIQLLPPRQRAMLILRDVLGWSAKETASLLEASVASANSALQQARATLKAHLPDRHKWARSSDARQEHSDPRQPEARAVAAARGLLDELSLSICPIVVGSRPAPFRRRHGSSGSRSRAVDDPEHRRYRRDVSAGERASDFCRRALDRPLSRAGRVEIAPQPSCRQGKTGY
jgi:DNA-directed RNA polymerase specialized sigma24 family protein